MLKWLIGLGAVAALLVATNPSRAEFNDWIAHYAMNKIESEARKEGREASSGERMFGGALVGMIVSNVPVERRNFILFSTYRLENVKASSNDGEDFPNCFVGIAGQFVGLNDC